MEEKDEKNKQLYDISLVAEDDSVTFLNKTIWVHSSITNLKRVIEPKTV